MTRRVKDAPALTLAQFFKAREFAQRRAAAEARLGWMRHAVAAGMWTYAFDRLEATT